MAEDWRALANGICAGSRRALARGITLVESTRAADRAAAEQLLQGLLAGAGGAVRIGLSGTPGVGKSTFIDAFGSHLTALGKRVGVLAVDPSSRRSGGAILGDKTRMERLARDPMAYIRPSPSSGTLGGVARRTRAAMILLEAAGFDVIIVETVGVGQSETSVADMTDIFVLLLAPGGGDELQGIKRGVMELADLVVVNKADGDLEPAAKRAEADYAGALGLIRPRLEGWHPRALRVSSLTGDGIADVWTAIEAHRAVLLADNGLARLRADQAVTWFRREIEQGLMHAFETAPGVAPAIDRALADVRAGRVAPSVAADTLLRRMFAAWAADAAPPPE